MTVLRGVASTGVARTTDPPELGRITDPPESAISGAGVDGLATSGTAGTVCRERRLTGAGATDACTVSWLTVFARTGTDAGTFSVRTSVAVATGGGGGAGDVTPLLGGKTRGVQTRGALTVGADKDWLIAGAGVGTERIRTGVTGRLSAAEGAHIEPLPGWGA